MRHAPEVYLFGQILGTHSFLLKDGFLQPDEYAEIKEQYFLPGGETGTAATVLSSLGVSVRMDGTWIGTQVAPMLKQFYADKQVDLSLLHDMDDDPGIMDGEQWEIELTLPGNRRRSYYGSNNFPPYWKDLQKVANRIVRKCRR